MLVPVYVKFNKFPQPNGIVSPVNENPIIVDPELDTENPASSAEPPETSVMVRPVNVIWKPPISWFELYHILPSEFKYIVFPGKFSQEEILPPHK